MVEKTIIAKRKSATGLGKIRPGSGRITVNGKDIKAYADKFLSLYIQPPLILSNGAYKKYDISIKVRGGGPAGRADVIRSVIAKALASKEKSLHKKFLEYDRMLLVDDKRITEPQKPYRSAARALKQTSYR